MFLLPSYTGSFMALYPKTAACFLNTNIPVFLDTETESLCSSRFLINSETDHP
jgi:hypothetical protein